MIKDLIKSIAFDEISLSQALTRAKLIESKIKNESFKNWIRNEIEGYNYDDQNLPKYRKIWSVINLKAEFPFNQRHNFPVLLPESYGEKILDSINNHRIIEPIPIVEAHILNFETSHAVIKIPPQQTEMLAKLYKNQVEDQGGVIREGFREVGKVQYQNVIEQTKQRLLDTLIELDKEFPGLSNDFVMNNENEQKIQNIITNNIYGDNNPTNIAAGEKIHQAISVSEIRQEDELKLKSLGVDQQEIDELKEIVKENSKDKTKLLGKSMQWLGSVSASIAGRGLYDNIPAITDFIQKLIS